MISIGPLPFIAIALVVYTVWRFFCIRRYGGGPARETLVALLSAYMLVVGSVVLFPIDIALYDWHGRFNFIPFAGIVDLVRHETARVALTNIAGNVLMFVPLGVLLPLVSPKVRSLGPLLWRAGVISLGIEGLQYLTRARSTDTDDIILNVIGAAAGFGLFRLLALLGARLPRVAALLDLSARRVQREPLISGLIPVGLTLLLTASLVFVPKAVAATLDESSISADVCSGLTSASVVAEADGDDYKILVAAGQEGSVEVFCWAEYKRVLPGRYAKTLGPTDPCWGDRSCYEIGSTVWDSRADDGPVTYIVGRNMAGASRLVASADGMLESLEAPVADYFVVILPGRARLDHAGIEVIFYDSKGNDVTALFSPATSLVEIP